MEFLPKEKNELNFYSRLHVWNAEHVLLNCPVQAIEVQSGVGCAWAMIGAALRGKDMDSGECGCGGEAGSCCGGNTEKISCSEK